MLHNVYLLTNQKKKIVFHYNGKIIHNTIYLDRTCKVLNVTTKLIELSHNINNKIKEFQKILVFTVY